MIDAPTFWWRQAGWRARALSPLSAIYASVARRKLVYAPREPVDLPVLCVGNFTVGGSGKTPVAIALAEAARRMGRKPGFLSRGHGGRIGQPHLVDPSSDDAALVGDEPLLLAAHAPVAVTPDRAAGARLLSARDCDFIVMDDGFQSARILIDHTLLVVDGRRGVGNGRVIPAGPLRAALADQMPFADSVLILGAGAAGERVGEEARRAGRTVLRASTTVRNPERFADLDFLAFAGIGHPGKFFETLRMAGGRVAIGRPFPDHHVYSDGDMDSLIAAAQSEKLSLVTTAKDAARLRRGGIAERFRDALEVMEIDIAFEPAEEAEALVTRTLESWEKRKGSVGPA